MKIVIILSASSHDIYCVSNKQKVMLEIRKFSLLKYYRSRCQLKKLKSRKRMRIIKVDAVWGRSYENLSHEIFIK